MKMMEVRCKLVVVAFEEAFSSTALLLFKTSHLYFGSSDVQHRSTEKRQARARPIGDLPMLDSLGGKGALASLDSLLVTCAGMNEVVNNIKCLDASVRPEFTHECLCITGLHHGCFLERSS